VRRSSTTARVIRLSRLRAYEVRSVAIDSPPARSQDLAAYR
jgi:hypothetical protein